MKARIIKAAGLALTALAVTAWSGSQALAHDAKHEDPLAAYKETGKTTRCLRLVDIDQTRILDAQNILFKLKSGKLYISKLPHRCPGLSRDRAISYSLSVPELCDLDIITVIDTGLHQEVGSCGLGTFHEVKEVEPASQGQHGKSENH